MKKIWIVSAFDNLPMEGYRAQRFWLMARAFQRTGWAVTYWTSSWSHANKAPRANVKEGEYEGIRLRLLEAPGYTRNVSVKRFWSHWVLARRFAEACAREEKPDLVVVASPTLGLVQAVRKRRLRYIVDVMDAWPETFERVVPRWLLGTLGLYRMARRNYLGAVGISVVARRYEELVRGYGYRGEAREFLHGIDMISHREREEHGENDSTRSTCSTRLKLVYAGNMSLSYDLETVIKTVWKMPDVTLDLAGSGPDESRLRNLAEGCDRIRFHGYVGQEELSKVLRESDVGVIPMFAASCVGVPYKLADYAVAGLPVLNSLEGETADLLSGFGAGIPYKAGDAQSLCRAITALKSSDRTALCRGAQHLAEHLDAQHIYAAYVKWACACVCLAQ